MADLVALQQAIGIHLNDLSLLEQALVHRSYLNENPEFALPCNERLEFLGDALLGFVVAERLYQESPDLAEGEMTKLRAALVCQEALASIALSIGLGDCLCLGRGEEANKGRIKPTNLARAFEAVVAAIFLDQGLAAVKDVILQLLGDRLQEITKREWLSTDYKSRLQELVQAKHQPIPTYRVVEIAGPDHDKRFTTEVLVGDVAVGKGSGKSKQMAEMEAARSALEALPGI